MTAASPAFLGVRSTLRVATLSDWHVGSGNRIPGFVDATVRRDTDGLPYLPGTTLTGVLRDACLTVARALDDGTVDGVWQRWHTAVFGDEPRHFGTRRLRPATIGIGPATVTAGLRRAVARDQAHQALRAATTFVKPGVRIDPDTGRAVDDMLRFVEMARSGLPLQAAATVDLPDGEEGRRAVTALLMLGAAWCDQVGGDRRRGAGRIRLRWDDHDPVPWAGWLAGSRWVPPEPAQPSTAAIGSAHLPPAADATAHGEETATWTRVALTLTTRTPVRVTRQTVGNIVHGHDHLPGSLLLPWLSDRWGNALVRAAVAAGTLGVRHAYPEVRGRRGVPAWGAGTTDPVPAPPRGPGRERPRPVPQQAEAAGPGPLDPAAPGRRRPGGACRAGTDRGDPQRRRPRHPAPELRDRAVHGGGDPRGSPVPQRGAGARRRGGHVARRARPPVVATAGRSGSFRRSPAGRVRQGRRPGGAAGDRAAGGTAPAGGRYGVHGMGGLRHRRPRSHAALHGGAGGRGARAHRAARRR